MGELECEIEMTETQRGSAFVGTHSDNLERVGTS